MVNSEWLRFECSIRKSITLGTPGRDASGSGTSGAGFGGAALASMLAEDLRAADPHAKERTPERKDDLKPKPPHFTPKARSVIQLMMPGGPSHVDMLDPKSALSVMTASGIPAWSTL